MEGDLLEPAETGVDLIELPGLGLRALGPIDVVLERQRIEGIPICKALTIIMDTPIVHN